MGWQISSVSPATAHIPRYSHQGEQQMPTRLRILIVSPTRWGTLRLSKHHYAQELVRQGHDVTFLNPPNRRQLTAFHADEEAGLRIVTFRPTMPMRLRNVTPRLYKTFMRLEVQRLTRALGGPWDLVWCFDPDTYPDLRWFAASQRIFHVVDQIEHALQSRVSEYADLTIAVSPSIADNLHHAAGDVLIIPHGLSAAFAEHARRTLEVTNYAPGRPVRLGYAGNLWIHSLNRSALELVIREQRECEFHFWGPLRPGDSNVGAAPSAAAEAFMRFLQGAPNVHLHGMVPSTKLPSLLADMDGLLLCYDAARDQNRGANSHKLLEYLATGRVIVASQVSDFADLPDLLQTPRTDTDEAYLDELRETVRNLGVLNAAPRRVQRIQYALANTYEQHLQAIGRQIGIELIPPFPPDRARSEVPRSPAAAADHMRTGE